MTKAFRAGTNYLKAAHHRDGTWTVIEVSDPDSECGPMVLGLGGRALRFKSQAMAEARAEHLAKHRDDPR